VSAGWLRIPLRASQAKITAIAISGFKTDGYLFKFYDFFSKRFRAISSNERYYCGIDALN